MNTNVISKDGFSNSQILVKTVNQANFNHSIDNTIAKLSTKLIIRPNSSLVCYQASEEGILHAKKHVFRYRAAEGAVKIAEISLGGKISLETGLAG